MLRRHIIFHGYQDTWWFLFSVALVLIAGALIFHLMRLERRLVTRRVGHVLLALRFAVLAVLLLAFLQPVLSWTIDRERNGRIIVAVDLSESMSTLDEHATPAEKLSWARALGMIGNSEIDARLDEWTQSFRDGQEPRWVTDGESPELAEIRKENLDGVFEELDSLSRKQIVLRLLNQTSPPILEELAEIANVEVVVFAGRSEAADPQTLAAMVADPPETLISEVSDLAQVLNASSGESGQSRVLGVVMWTDGRNNGNGDPISGAVRLGQMSAPVHSVVMGSLHKPKDLSILSLQYPRKVFRNDKPVAKVVVGTAGYAGTEIKVSLQKQGAEPVTKTIVPDGESANIEFELEADELGRHEYTVLAEPQPGETRADNNEKVMALSVINDKVKVLLLEGAARWEFRFIDNALSRDERVEVERVVFDQPYLGVLRDTFFPRQLSLPPDPNDLANSPFAEADLIVVGDVPPEKMTNEVWALLETYVAESSGTLVITAGKRFMPHAFRSPILRRLLPVSNLRPVSIDGLAATGSPTERGFQLQLTADGDASPMFQFDTDPSENHRIWSSLSGHMWGLFGPAKRGATVYATAAHHNQDAALDAEREAGVFVHQHYGFGQVLWIGIDSTWRWRFRHGDKYHHRFWGQLCRWAAENKAVAGNDFVKFGPVETDIEVGQAAVFRARWTQEFFRQHPRMRARARLDRIDSEGELHNFSEVELEPSDRQPLVSFGALFHYRPDDTECALEIDGIDLAEPVETSLYVHERTTPELSEMSANLELLQQLAAVSDGRVFLPHEVHEIVREFQDPEDLAALRNETELWDHWTILLLFFVLLTGEWVIRKLNGLP